LVIKSIPRNLNIHWQEAKELDNHHDQLAVVERAVNWRRAPSLRPRGNAKARGVTLRSQLSETEAILGPRK
jgi:hypothetical protein